MQPLPESPRSVFGELEDDSEWVALYPEDKPGCSLQKPSSHQLQLQPSSSSATALVVDHHLPEPQWSQSLVFRKKVPRDEVLASEWRDHLERKKALGKRKSAFVSEDAANIEEMKKLEECRQRKKAYVGDLEERLGTMSCAIEELNCAVNSIGRNSEARNHYLYQAPACAMNCYGAGNGSKPVRSKRPKLCKRDRGGSLLRKLKKFASTAFVLVLCLVMLFFPIKVGMQGIQGFVLAKGSSAKWIEQQQPAKVSPWDVSNDQVFHGPHLEGGDTTMERPATIPDNQPFHGPHLEDVNHGGGGGGGTMERPSKGTSLSVPFLQQNTSRPLKKNSSQPLQPWKRIGKFFTTGKCTEVFQYKPLESVVSQQILQGNALSENGGSSMKVSILPRKSSGKTKEVFVVIVIDGVKYVTYSCTLPHQISP